VKIVCISSPLSRRKSALRRLTKKSPVSYVDPTGDPRLFDDAVTIDLAPPAPAPPHSPSRGWPHPPSTNNPPTVMVPETPTDRRRAACANGDATSRVRVHPAWIRYILPR
jgi:hypothetical protein